MTVDVLLQHFLMYLVVPVWLLAGLADWLCHRTAHIECTSGVFESVLHLVQFALVGLPLLAVLFLYFYNFRQTGTYSFSIEQLYKTAPHIFSDPAYSATYAILLFLAVALGLSTAFVVLPMLVAKLTGADKPYPDKLTEYECGFPAFEDSRAQFDVRFYLVAILFIVFDIEAAYLFPWAVSVFIFESHQRSRSSPAGEEPSGRVCEARLGRLGGLDVAQPALVFELKVLDRDSVRVRV